MYDSSYRHGSHKTPNWHALLLGIKKRNHKLLDYDATRAKVKKLVEKPDKDPTKLPRAERESDLAKTAYEALNEQLFSELPQLIDLRVPYLDPSFEALVKIQLRFCAEAYSRMAQVQQFLDADTREQYAQGHLDSRVEQVLGEIRELSIAGTVWIRWRCPFDVMRCPQWAFCSTAYAATVTVGVSPRDIWGKFCLAQLYRIRQY